MFDPDAFEEKAGETRRSLRSMHRYSGAGLAFAVSILVFAGAGYWLDTKLDSSPWFLLVGVFTGFPLALYSLVKKLEPPRDRADETE